MFLGSEVARPDRQRHLRAAAAAAAEDPDTDIFLYINSPGGSVSAGMAIYDTMQYVQNDVATVAMGLAASMGQFLLCAGAPGKRYALPHARIMMHQPSGGLGGTASDIEIQAEQMLHTKKQMAELIAEHTGQTVEQIETDSDRDRWFTAEEAKDYGFVDHVVLSAGQVADREASQMSDMTLEPERERLASRSGAGDLGNPCTSRRPPLRPPAVRGAHVLRLSARSTRTPSSSRSASSSSARQIDDASPTTSWRSCCAWSRWTPTATSPSTSTRPGGSFTALTAIYDTMQFVKPDIQTVCLGQAASAAAVLLAAGTPGKRLALPNSRILIHQPYTEGASVRPPTSRSRPTRSCGCGRCWSRCSPSTAGKTVEEVSRDIERDKILTAEAAVEYGLVDQVLESRKASLVGLLGTPTRRSTRPPCTQARRGNVETCTTNAPSGSNKCSGSDRRSSPRWHASATAATC